MNNIYIIIKYIEHLTPQTICHVLYIHCVYVFACVYYLTFIIYNVPCSILSVYYLYRLILRIIL